MQQVFVCATGQLRERWERAFPCAQVVANLAALSDVSPIVIWLDISTESGAMLNEVGRAVALGCPVVAMAATPGEAEAFAVLKAGCAGYCHVNAAEEQLREISLVVEHGGLWMPPELMQRLLALSVRLIPGEPVTAEPELNTLTARELMVAEQVAHGASNREIAQVLEITERTVKAHMSAIFEKLAVRDRVQLALAMNNIPTHSTIN